MNVKAKKEFEFLIRKELKENSAGKQDNCNTDKAAQKKGKEKIVDVVTGLDQTQIEKITQFFLCRL